MPICHKDKKTEDVPMSYSFYFHNISRLCNRRYVFVDEEGIYYVWQFWFSEFGANLEITPFILEDEKFVETQTDKAEELIEYLKHRLLNKTELEIREFCKYLTFLELNIPKTIEEKFGERFCNFLHDRDKKFIYQDPNAKHWIIDFEKIKNNDPDFLKEPPLLPFTITELGVTLTKEEELLKDGKKINVDKFWKIVEEY